MSEHLSRASGENILALRSQTPQDREEESVYQATQTPQVSDEHVQFGGKV